MKNRVAAVVVTYNRKDMLKECIEALSAQTAKNLDIFIIDNASTDGTKESVQPYINNHTIQYYNTGENLGGAGGFHYGIKTAMKQPYDYLWIMDDDTIADPAALSELLSAAEKLGGEFGFLSSYVYWSDGSNCRMNRQQIDLPSIWNDMDLYQKYQMLPVLTASFVSCLIPAKCIREVGLPISEFYIWCDDIEYTGRISKNYKSYLVTASRVLHKMKNNNPALIQEDDMSRRQRYIYKYRNLYYIASRDKKRKHFFYQIAFDIRAVIKESKDCKRYRILAIVKGTLKGFFFKPRVEYIDGES